MILYLVMILRKIIKGNFQLWEALLSKSNEIEAVLISTLSLIVTKEHKDSIETEGVKERKKRDKKRGESNRLVIDENFTP